MVPYFTYDDIKESNSFMRYVFLSPIVGTLKGATWPVSLPYSIYANREKYLDQNVITYFKTLHYIKEYNLNYQKFMANSDKLFLEKAMDNIHFANSEFKKCKTIELNKYYKGWASASSNLKIYFENMDELINLKRQGQLETTEFKQVEMQMAKAFSRHQVWLTEHYPSLLKALKKENYDLTPIRKISSLKE